MTLPALASLEAFEIRLGRDLGDAEDRAQAALDDASALIRSVAGKTWVTDDELDDVPDAIVAVTLKSARRAFGNPDDLTSENVGNTSLAFGASVFLTDDERSAVLSAVGNNGIGSLPLETPWSFIGNEYVDVIGSDKPLPFTYP